MLTAIRQLIAFVEKSQMFVSWRLGGDCSELELKEATTRGRGLGGENNEEWEKQEEEGVLAIPWLLEILSRLTSIKEARTQLTTGRSFFAFWNVSGNEERGRGENLTLMIKSFVRFSRFSSFFLVSTEHAMMIVMFYPMSPSLFVFSAHTRPICIWSMMPSRPWS